VVIDCTGVFKTEAALAPYFAAGVKKVVVSAPGQGRRRRQHRLRRQSRHLRPRAAPDRHGGVLHDKLPRPGGEGRARGLGIRHGSITTIHDVTNTQTIVDRPAKDLRRARSALNSLIPTTTGSATAITLIYPELKGRLNGHAVRVPLLNASLTDCVFEVERASTVEEVNALFKAAAEGPLKGILGYEERPLVSTDYTNDTRSSIVDAPSTMVVNGTQLKVYAWYDNEMGYAHRLVDVALMVGTSV
jgi:glyceraldehyde 3-phosphate dehydrogenase